MRRYFLPLLLGAAFLGRIGFGLLHPDLDAAGRLDDQDSYFAIASAFSDSWTLKDAFGETTAMREPLYPVALGCWFKIFGARYGAVLAFNSALCALTVWLLYGVGRRLFGDAPAAIAAVIFAFYPASVFYAAELKRESMLALAGVALIAVLLEAQRRKTARAHAAAGVVGACAGLLNTTLLPFALIAAPVGLLWADRKDSKRATARTAAYLAAFCALYALWPIRNYAAFGRFIFGSTAGAASSFYSYMKIPPEVAGTSEETRLNLLDPVNAAARDLTPAEREGYYWRAGFREVRENPLAFVRRVAWRFFVDIWRVLPRPRPNEFSPRLIRWVSLLSDGWILPMGLLGLLSVRRDPPQIVWAYALVASVHAVYALILTSIRYRMTAMPWVILLASVALSRGWERLRTLRTGG
ncbi:MAG: hypothetical protein COR54_15930 [Elusimicrobia bacterium CG22_combo_CG10-13_8_21_14_all_63_91]|nr:MAG: hypothetical protein COR54_15930 [Elusimicrobia bacterium CG22_combo_CG10-13_8_21_14_all_63_91]